MKSCRTKRSYSPQADKGILDPEGSTYVWRCEVDERNTTIWANFHKFDPNKELVEITTRHTCFYPSKQGVDYLTVCGFEFSQAATQWGAPTAEQIGMVATHWNKGWIIENNIIHDSKCAGITLGKERSSGHNTWLCRFVAGRIAALYRSDLQCAALWVEQGQYRFSSGPQQYDL